MKTKIGKPLTFMAHPVQEQIRVFLRQQFAAPDSKGMGEAVAAFLNQHQLPMEDFPAIENSYSRTILMRAVNGYEAMAARWSQGAITAIHGHPSYAFYYLLHGELLVDDFQKSGAGLEKIATRTYRPGDYFNIHGENGTFDNGIHRITVIKESLSIHIYSDNALKGEVFDLT